MVQIVAVLNSKGGSGKTSAAVNLAAALGEDRRRVLLVDLDPQASASRWMGIDPNAPGASAWLATRGSFTPAPIQTPAAGVHLVPPGSGLAAYERPSSPAEASKTFQAIRRGAAETPGRWDIVLLDCPPADGALSRAALGAAGWLLAPVEASAMALDGVDALLATVAEIQAGLNPALRVAGAMIGRVDTRATVSRDVRDVLATTKGLHLFKTWIRETTRMREAPSYHLPITMYAPRCTAAQDYRAAAAELWARIKSAK